MSIIYWTKKQLKNKYKSMTDKGKPPKKEYQRNYDKKEKFYKDDLLLEKPKEVKKVANYYKARKK